MHLPAGCGLTIEERCCLCAARIQIIGDASTIAAALAVWDEQHAGWPDHEDIDDMFWWEIVRARRGDAPPGL